MKRLIALLIACSAQAALAATPGVPNFDVGPSCLAGIEATGQTHPMEQCLAQENSARAELEKGWSQFASGDRTHCIAEIAGFAPSYVELLTCLIISRDARALEREATRR